MVKCRNCNGKGFIRYEDYGNVGCASCDGTGAVYPEPKESDAYTLAVDSGYGETCVFYDKWINR